MKHFNQAGESMFKRTHILLLLTFVLMVALPPLLKATPRPNESQKNIELNSVLTKTADYCEKLKVAVFHFFCREQLHETVGKRIKYPSEKESLKNFLEGRKERQEPSRYSAINELRQRRKTEAYDNKKRSITNSYVNDYQIIKHNGNIRELRIMVSMNGKKVEGKKPGATTFLYSFKNAITPIYLFSRESQNKYRYRLLGTDKLMGRRAYKLEVSLKGKDAAPIVKGKEDVNKLALAWVDETDFSVMKIKVMPGAIKGYSKLLEAKKNKLVNLAVSDVHLFGFHRQGIRYPTKTDITLSYSKEPKSHVRSSRGDPSRVSVGGLEETEVKTSIIYDKYVFYNVAVDEPVFKDMN